MAKVTSKLQVTVPKALAERYGIAPGDEIEWEAAGDAIRVVPRRTEAPDVARRLEVFDHATARQRDRERRARSAPAAKRDWTREDLYQRGRPR